MSEAIASHLSGRQIVPGRATFEVVRRAATGETPVIQAPTTGTKRPGYPRGRDPRSGVWRQVYRLAATLRDGLCPSGRSGVQSLKPETRNLKPLVSYKPRQAEF